MSAPLADTLWAWVTTSADGKPSMIGTLIEFTHTPLVTVREDLARGPMRELALRHHKASGQPVWLVRYQHDAVLEELPIISPLTEKEPR
jgi:hypothetical protein